MLKENIRIGPQQVGTSIKWAVLKYFSTMKIRCFNWTGENDDNAIKLAFDKDVVPARNQWVLERVIYIYMYTHTHTHLLFVFSFMYIYTYTFQLLFFVCI